MSMLSEFVSIIKSKGIAKQTKFVVSFSLPQALINSMQQNYGNANGQGVFSANPNTTNVVPSDISQQMFYTCVGVSLPGHQISTSEIHYGITTRKIPYEKNTGECDTVFLLTGLMEEKKLFDAWLRLIFGGNHKLTYYEDYISDVTINVLDDNENVVYKITLTEAYPVTVTPVQMDKTSPSSHTSLNVTWEFHKIHYEDDEANGQRINTANANTVDSSTFLNQIDELSNQKNPAAQNAGMIPAPVITNPHPDIIAALNRIENIKFLLSHGINSKNVGSLLNTVAQDVTAMTGVPTDQVQAVAGYANALAKGMPIGLAGLGTTPIR